MSKPVEKTLLFLSDFLTVNAAFLCWAKLRAQAGLFSEPIPQQLLLNSAALFCFWLLLFFFYGLYRSWHAQSRVDELFNLSKTIAIGVSIIFLATLDLQQDLQQPLKFSRAMIFSYGLLMLAGVGLGRLALRTFQRTLLEAGLGARNVLIVGGGDKAREVFDELRKLPALGYNLIGFVANEKFHSYKGAPWLGEVPVLSAVLKREEVHEVIFAFEEQGRNEILAALQQCEGLPVRLKLAPSLNDAVLGQVRSHQVYGFPLIDIMRENMPAWERRVKRAFDISVASVALLFLLPLALLIIIALRRRPLLHGEPHIGKAGKPFRLYRFHIGEWDTLAEGGFLRLAARMHWDKIPRLLNVLRGELSLIGPRPESLEMAEKRKREMPLYAQRWRVQPGLTGWAQIKASHEEAAKNLQRDLQHDFFYIENMSLRMDVKILLIALYDAMLTRGAQSPRPKFLLSEAPFLK